MSEIDNRRAEAHDAEYGLELEDSREELAIKRDRIAELEAINADLVAALAPFAALAVEIRRLAEKYDAEPEDFQKPIAWKDLDRAGDLIAKAKP